MSSSAGLRGSIQGGGSRDLGTNGRGAGPPNAAPVTLRGRSSNRQEQGSSPSGNSQTIRRSQAAALSPRTRGQQAAALSPGPRGQQAATLSPRTRGQQAAALSPRTRSQATALSPMTRSQAAAGRHGFTNPLSRVGGMSSRSQQERQQERRPHERQHERQQERPHERQQQTPPMTTRTTTAGGHADIERDLGVRVDELEREASRREDSNRTALTTTVRRRLEMDDHDGLTRTKLRKVSQEFMHDKVVKELLFPKQKFATLAELDFSNSPHSICRFMASKLQIEGEEEVKSWWDGVKKHVNDALKRHRNNVIKTIKQLFRDKILQREGYFVAFDLNQIAGMRSPESKERYIDFLDCLVKAVVGYSKYMENRTRQPLSQWFTLTDEAFLMVCIESYMTKWRHDWMVQRLGPPATLPPRDSSPQFYEARYTGKSHGTKRSWSKEGLERFNALMIDVFRNRQEHGAAFDADFLEEMKFRYASGIDAASGQSAEEAEVIPVVTAQPTIVYNDFNMELLLAHANITGGAGMNGEQQPDDGVRGVSV